MKICVVQLLPVKGDITANIINHKKWIELAIINGADIILFPDLSITGYEPELAKDLAVNPDDIRFNDFQSLADTYKITLAIGAPTGNDGHICISMIIFQPNQPRNTYHKQYLHSSEMPFFSSGKSFAGLLNGKPKVAIAICYEISVPEHAANAVSMGAEVYVASLVESFTDIDKAHRNLSAIATKYSIPVLMANCVGKTGNYSTAGKSAVWNNLGVLLHQLDETAEGLLIYDTSNEEVITL